MQGLVVGEGPDVAAVTCAVERSEGAVRVLGFRADALEIMHAADVVCLTSAVEALPMSVLEAMSVARPVIATGVGGVSEAVQDGETGILIPRDRPSELAAALVGLARDRLRAESAGTGRPSAPAAVVLDRCNDARIRGSSGRSRPCSRAVVPPQAVMERSSEGMKRPHIVIVNQNALLELDLRPRREAETLVAAGYLVTLVGGCRSPDTAAR